MLIYKALSAIAAAATGAALVMAVPGFSPAVEAGTSNPIIKTDRIDNRPLGSDCTQQAWPYYGPGCLRDRAQADGQARTVRPRQPRQAAALSISRPAGGIPIVPRGRAGSPQHDPKFARIANRANIPVDVQSLGRGMMRRWLLVPTVGLAWFAVMAAAPLLGQTPPSERDLRVYAGLHAAAAKGDVSTIETLVAGGEKPDLQDLRSRTPLLVAAYQHQTAAAQALLRLGASPSARDQDGYDVLAVAAFNNDLELLKAALASGADARAVVGPDDGSALITAAHLGHVEIVQALIEAKALLDHANALGWTAVTTAVVLGSGDKEHTAVIQALVSAGADVDFKDRQGRKAIDYARQRGYSEIVHMLETASARHT